MDGEQRDSPEAWTKSSTLAMLPSESSQFTGQRIERIFAIVTGVGALVLGMQTLIAGIGGFAAASALDRSVFLVTLVSLFIVTVSCFLGRAVRLSCGAFSVIYMLALALWSLEARATLDQPWIFFLVNIATVTAILAFPMALQIVVVIALPVLYGLGRLSQRGLPYRAWVEATFDVTFTLILGVVLLALAWMFRSIAAEVDRERGEAVAGFAAAAATEAAEEERMALAALMHDSVLAALQAAERAESPREKELAVTMAREALTRLANTEELAAREGSEAPVEWARIVSGLRRILSELGADAVVEVRGHGGDVAERVARATLLAARQACLNAMEHAQGRGMHIIAEGCAEGFTVTISDAGTGFATAKVPEDRLGIRASIVARMAAVAGAAEVSSSRHGTVVTLSWPAP